MRMSSAVLLIACVLAIASPMHAQPPSHAEKSALAAHLRQLCTRLQKDGWEAPGDPLDRRRKELAEFDIPGVAYYCNLEHPLPGTGPGHAPLMQALISDSGEASGVIFSAQFWCAADSDAAFSALAAQLEKQLAAISVAAPAEILAAARTGAERDVEAGGLHFKAVRYDIDPHACSKVAENTLGAVLAKLEVVIEARKAQRD